MQLYVVLIYILNCISIIDTLSLYCLWVITFISSRMYILISIMYCFNIVPCEERRIKTNNLIQKLIKEHSEAFYAKLEIAHILHANKCITQIHCGCKGLFCPAVCNTDLQRAIDIHNNAIQNKTLQRHQ